MKKWLFSISLLLVLSSVMFVSAGFFDFFKSEGGITGDVIAADSITNDLSDVAVFGSEDVTNAWLDVDFPDPEFFSDDGNGNVIIPVVIATMTTNNDITPAHVSIESVDENGFRMRIEEWDFTDDPYNDRDAEKVSWIAIRPGDYTLDGKRIVAGSINAVNDVFVDVPVNDFQAQEAAIVAQAQSATNNKPVVTRITNVDLPQPSTAPYYFPIINSNKSSFKVRLQREEALVEDTYSDEIVGFIMAEKGFYDSPNGFLETKISINHDESLKEIPFRHVDFGNHFVVGNLVTPKWNTPVPERVYFTHFGSIIDYWPNSQEGDCGHQKSGRHGNHAGGSDLNPHCGYAFPYAPLMDTAVARIYNFGATFVEVIVEEDTSVDDGDVTHASTKGHREVKDYESEEVHIFHFGTKGTGAVSGTGTGNIGSCTDLDGGVNYFKGANTTLDDDVTFNEDSCSMDGNSLTEYYCGADGQSISSQPPFDCNCLEDDDGFGYCEISDDLVCGDVEFSYNEAGEIVTVLGATADDDVLASEVELARIDGSIQTKIHNKNLFLTLPLGPVGSRSDNLDLVFTTDLNSYYCGLDLKWHQTKPTLESLNCMEFATSGTKCDDTNWRKYQGDNAADDTNGKRGYNEDENGDLLTEANALAACLEGEGCGHDTIEEIEATVCLQDYTCQSNSCVDGYCISISSELKAQRGILNQMWCAILNLPSFIADGGVRSGPYRACVNPGA